MKVGKLSYLGTWYSIFAYCFFLLFTEASKLALLNENSTGFIRKIRMTLSNDIVDFVYLDFFSNLSRMGVVDH